MEEEVEKQKWRKKGSKMKISSVLLGSEAKSRQNFNYDNRSITFLISRLTTDDNRLSSRTYAYLIEDFRYAFISYMYINGYI